MWHLAALYIINIFNPFNNSTFHNSINRYTEVDMITFIFFFFFQNEEAKTQGG